MSLEVHKYINPALEKKGNIYNAAVIEFPKEKKIKNPVNLTFKKSNFWKLYDKSNINEDDDQLKAVFGICFMLGALVVMGLYSNLT